MSANGAVRRPWKGGTDGPSSWSAEKKRDHPASRPGTGRPVLWRNQVHVVSPSMRCFACGLYKDEFTGGLCYCGGNNWFETGLHVVPPTVQSGPGFEDDASPAQLVAGAHFPTMVVHDYQGARLNELLGGVKHRALLLVAGAAGAGKSTACAELAAYAARHWSQPERGHEQQPNCKICWLDSDQKDGSLVRECFRVANVESAFVSRVLLLPERSESYTFDEALRMLPKDARVVVCDSLEKWGANDTERVAVLDKLRAHPAWLKLVIAGTNKLGGVSGVGALERADDATIYAERTADARYTLRFTKRRWQPCASARARCAGEVGTVVEEPAAEARPHAQPVLRATGEPKPGAIDDAARTVHDVRATDRDQPATDCVSRESVEAASSAQADLPDVEPDDETGPLPERMEAPYALFLRSWPWTEGVRVTNILAAWHYDERQLEDLWRALRELTRTTDGSIPSGLRIGNALRWVRGHTIDGMTLTCERDRRTKIATWRVVREK